MNQKNKLVMKAEEFKWLQRSLIKFGASDSEPNHCFRSLMTRACRGDAWSDPGLGKWDLFSSVDGWEQAEKQLSAKAKELHEEIQKSSLLEVKEFMKYYGYE